MRKIVKRIAAAASAVVIGGVSCVTTWFSVPVAAAGGFGWLEWAEFQSLLQGVGWSSGGGSYKSVQEATLDWLNMTSDQFYKLTDPTDGGNAKPIWEQSWWGDMTDWLDNVVHSWSEDYSSIPDVGTDVSGGSNIGQLSDDGTVFRISFPSHDSVLHNDSDGIFFRLRDDTIPHDPIILNFFIDRLGILWMYLDSMSYSNWISARSSGSVYGIMFGSYPSSGGVIYNALSKSGDLYFFTGADNGNLKSLAEFWRRFINVLSDNGFELKQSNLSRSDFLASCSDLVFSGQNPGGFVGPVYTYLAAQDLYKSTGTAAGVRLDVQTQDGVPDLQAALDGAGVDTVDDLVAGVAAGTVPMSKVFADAKVTPYVVADTTSGTVVTDLGVSATATGVKAVGLTQDLAVPKDLTKASTYVIKGKTWDPEMSKYKLPLFQYFPFCLPWDIYQVLAAFSADPVAPVFDIPVGKILSGVRSADVSKAASLSAKIDFGDDNWSKVFEVIRILECAGIIVGLCLVAVYLIHGGR